MFAALMYRFACLFIAPYMQMHVLLHIIKSDGWHLWVNRYCWGLLEKHATIGTLY